MKRLIAIVLGIALLSPTHANANGSTYQLLTPVLTTTYELPAQTYNSRWGTIEIPFSVILISDGTVASFHFNLIDAEGFEIAYKQNISPNNLKIGTHYDPVTWTQNNKWTLFRHGKAKLPIRLQTEIEFWRSTGKASITQTFPMNFTIHKDDLAEKSKADAVAKAQAEAVAKAQAEAQRVLAEAKAKVEAELRAKQEAELRAKQEAELKAKQEAEARAIAEAKAAAELKAKQEAEARAIAEAKAKEAELKAKQEAEARAIAEAKAKEQEAKEAEKLQSIWSCTLFPNYNKMTYAEASKLCPKLEAEAKAKEIAAERANAEAFLKPFLGKSCKVLGDYKVNKADPTLGNIKCVKVKGKKVWGKLKLN